VGENFDDGDALVPALVDLVGELDADKAAADDDDVLDRFELLLEPGIGGMAGLEPVARISRS
jgi:hypothetical protein